MHSTDRSTAPPFPCRFCAEPVTRTVVDLGVSPLCQTIIAPERLEEMEPFYPLHLRVCERCFLVQLPQVVSPEEIFGEYAYFSSYSDSWVAHAHRYQEAMTARLGLAGQDLVVEVASNDGYLLQHFKAAGVPVLGIEPAANVARAAQERGIPTKVAFLDARTGEAVARETGGASLVAANNVFAHVPDVNGFTEGLARLLRPDGVLTLEFPHLQRLVEGNQFDTIYHEHFSYLSFTTARAILESHGLAVLDVEELPTHGGSLRVYASRRDGRRRDVGPAVDALVERERRLGYRTMAPYEGFGERVAATRRDLLRFLIDQREAGRTVVGYGAPGKSATLLNYCGVRSDLLAYTVDRNPYKQGRFLPGTRIPVHPPERIAQTRPDVVLILPWNLRSEIAQQLAYVGEWGGRLAVPIPAVEVFDPPTAMPVSAGREREAVA